MSLPFNPKKGLIIVPIRLWGPRGDTIVRLALDTGATGSLVSWDSMMILAHTSTSGGIPRHSRESGNPVFVITTTSGFPPSRE